MTRFPFLRRTLPALAFGLLFAAAASAQPSTQRSLSDRIARAVPDLTDTQKSQLDALTIPSRQDRQPGDAWGVAANATDILTADQIETLLAARDEAISKRGDRARRGGKARMGRGQRGRMGRGLRRGARARAGGPQLSEEQREALRESRQAARGEREALVEQFRSGAIDASTFQSRSEALREQQQAARRANATPEQIERMEAAQERRDAAKAAREAALSLTSAQKEQMEAIRLERIRMSPGAPDLRPYLDADGQLDRQALREARRAQREEMSDERMALRQRAESILTDEQKATIALHRMMARGQRVGRAGEGRRGMRGAGRRGRR
ncbi:MAG: Spy/CpxP family protein refolding chaperone [Bacteroidota bacterium]